MATALEEDVIDEMAPEQASTPAPAPVPTVPPPNFVRAPLPSYQEQQQRWETPYDRQLANDIADAKYIQQQQQQARLNQTRQAVQAATDFVRRKEVERMVRDGASLEDAEFKSRVQYGMGSGAQLNALRPVPPPSVMTLGGRPAIPEQTRKPFMYSGPPEGEAAAFKAAPTIKIPAQEAVPGVPGVVSGTRGQNFRPLNAPESDKPIKAGNKLIQVGPDGTAKVIFDPDSNKVSEFDRAEFRESLKTQSEAEKKLKTLDPGSDQFDQQQQIWDRARKKQDTIRGKYENKQESKKVESKNYDSVADAKRAGAKTGDEILLWNPHKNKYGRYLIGKDE